MLTLDVLVFLVIIFFGLIWHDESSERPPGRTAKMNKP